MGEDHRLGGQIAVAYHHATIVAGYFLESMTSAMAAAAPSTIPVCGAFLHDYKLVRVWIRQGMKQQRAAAEKIATLALMASPSVTTEKAMKPVTPPDSAGHSRSLLSTLLFQVLAENGLTRISSRRLLFSLTATASRKLDRLLIKIRTEPAGSAQNTLGVCQMVQ